MTRKRLRPAHVLLAAGLLITPVVLILDWAGLADELTLFVLAALALLPLSWVIGEATDQLANHTGPGIGGFLNATFGNAPELIIALIAVSSGLTEIVRASLVGSVAGNLLLVLGLTLLLGRQGPIDRRPPTCPWAWSGSPLSWCWPRPRPASTATRTAGRSPSCRC